MFQDREGVEEADVLHRLPPRRLFEVVEFGGLGGAFGFECVEATAEPVSEGPVADVGGFEFGDEPVLPCGEVLDLGLQQRTPSGASAVTPVGEVGESGS